MRPMIGGQKATGFRRQYTYFGNKTGISYELHFTHNNTKWDVIYNMGGFTPSETNRMEKEFLQILDTVTFN